MSAVTFGPYTQLREIARACEEQSTETTEVYAEIRTVRGKPIVILRRQPQPEGIEALLSHGSDLALCRRQAG